MNKVAIQLIKAQKRKLHQIEQENNTEEQSAEAKKIRLQEYEAEFEDSLIQCTFCEFDTLKDITAAENIRDKLEQEKKDTEEEEEVEEEEEEKEEEKLIVEETDDGNESSIKEIEDKEAASNDLLAKRYKQYTKSSTNKRTT